jgi:hypothetical protein
MTISFDPRKGLTIVPLTNTRTHRNVIGAIEAQALSA